MDLILLNSHLVVSLVSTGLGALLIFLIQKIVNKRGLFTYYVRHNQVGVSTDDVVFGTIKVTWNDKPTSQLYLSVIEMKNESLKDYENVVMKVYTNDTRLLTEQSELVDTTHYLQPTEEFSNKLTKLAVELETESTQEQINFIYKEREYLLPTMNRGQVVRVTYLNEALTDRQPSLWIDIVHKGVKIKFRAPHNVIMGVSQPHAALIGSALGLLVLVAVIWFIDTTWIASVICMVYGLVVLVPGAVCIKSWRWLRDSSGG